MFIEIDENLMRSELSPTETAEHLARRKEVWADRESGASRLTLTGRGNKAFAQSTADATGMDKSTVTRAVARGGPGPWEPRPPFLSSELMCEARANQCATVLILHGILAEIPWNPTVAVGHARYTRFSEIHAQFNSLS